MHVLFTAIGGVKWYFLYVFPIFTQSACSRFPFGMTYLSCTKSKLAGPHRLMSRPDTCIGLCIYVSTCGGVEHGIFRLKYCFI